MCLYASDKRYADFSLKIHDAPKARNRWGIYSTTLDPLARFNKERRTGKDNREGDREERGQGKTRKDRGGQKAERGEGEGNGKKNLAPSRSFLKVGACELWSPYFVLIRWYVVFWIVSQP